MAVTQPLSDDEIRGLVNAHKTKELTALQSLRPESGSPEAFSVKARIAGLQAQLMNHPDTGLEAS